VPLDWAATQNNLGVALTTLGERESGTAHLEAAAAAYQAALQEETRDRVPLAWAMTQNNLGIRAGQAGRTGERDGASGGSGCGLSGGAGGTNARSGAARLGGDAEQPWRRADHTGRPEEALTCMLAAAEVYRQSQNTYELSVANTRIAEMKAALLRLQR
jgi:hypothetical protein